MHVWVVEWRQSPDPWRPYQYFETEKEAKCLMDERKGKFTAYEFRVRKYVPAADSGDAAREKEKA